MIVSTPVNRYLSVYDMVVGVVVVVAMRQFPYAARYHGHSHLP